MKKTIAYTLMQWVCLVLLHVKVKYQLSNTVLGIILGCFAVVFAFFCYPLVGLFPTSTQSLLTFTGASRDGVDSTIFVVCPNEKCNAIYKYE